MISPSQLIERGRAPARFATLWPRDGGLGLFAEFAHFVVAIPDIERLRDGDASLTALAPERLTLLRAKLEHLAAQGLWLAPGVDDEPTRYLRPDFGALPRALELAGASASVLSLCDPVQDPLIAELAASLELPDELRVVVVDDLLDPRLAAIDEDQRRTGDAWLVLRLSGDHPCVGPVFNIADEGPCWTCVQFRALWNQPVRRWYQRVHGGPLAPVPVAWRPEALLPELASFAAIAQDMVATRRAQLMLEPGLAGSRTIHHRVIRRPQCPACGVPELYARRARAPVVIGPAPKRWTRDGGLRTQTPDETAARLESVVGPVSGLIGGVSCHSEPDPRVNQIFRAHFCKTSFAPGIPATEALFQTTLGKGMSAAQSRVSAMSEALERLASNYHGDEPVVRARASELPGRAIEPAQLAPYSASQYAQFRRASSPAMHAMHPLEPDAVIAWTPVWSLTRAERCFVPMTWCYANSPDDGDLRCRFFHNGGAAGNCLEEALLQGLLELIERDAVAIWWYNRLRRPAVRCDSLSAEFSEQLDATVGVHSDRWVLDLTHDLGVPVFAAVSRERETGGLCLGFGAHLDAQLALERSLTELCQILEIRKTHSAPFEFDAIASEAYLFPADPEPVGLDRHRLPTTTDIGDDLRRCISRLSAHGLEVLALDYSRPDFPLRTAKVIVPGTCHLFPYRGARRLYEVPVDMGWLDRSRTEVELNPMDLLI